MGILGRCRVWSLSIEFRKGLACVLEGGQGSKKNVSTRV